MIEYWQILINWLLQKSPASIVSTTGILRTPIFEKARFRDTHSFQADFSNQEGSRKEFAGHPIFYLRRFGDIHY